MREGKEFCMTEEREKREGLFVRFRRLLLFSAKRATCQGRREGNKRDHEEIEPKEAGGSVVNVYFGENMKRRLFRNGKAVEG